MQTGPTLMQMENGLFHNEKLSKCVNRKLRAMKN